MKDKIIKFAIMYPHLFPWSEKFRENNICISHKELEDFLKGEDVNSNDRRRIVSWELDRLIYSLALESNTVGDMVFKVREEYRKLSQKPTNLSQELIIALASRKDLNNETKLGIYKSFVEGKFSKTENSQNKEYICNWATDLIMMDMFSDKSVALRGQDELIGAMDERLKTILYEDNYNKESIVRKLKRSGLMNIAVNTVFTKNFSKYHSEYKKLTQNISTQGGTKQNEKQNNGEYDITAELMGMVNEYENNVKHEPRNAIKYSNKGVNKKVETLNNQIGCVKENLEKMAQILGYELVKIENRYDSKDIVLFKKLLNIVDGAVLSELYNLYKNIENEDKDNIKAILGNFFSVLFEYGLETDEHSGKIGQEVKVNSKDILSKFLLSKPVDEDGEIKGVIKYYGWKYKGKSIMPLVVKPNKGHENTLGY